MVCLYLDIFERMRIYVAKPIYEKLDYNWVYFNILRSK